MSKKSVIFIEPRGDQTNVFENYMRLPLLGSLYLATILHDAGYNVRVYNENILPKPVDPFDLKADVICISALTVSANRASFLAHEIRRLHPSVRILIGGIHATLVPEEFETVADTIVCGEAENIIIDLIEDRFNDKIVNGSPVENLNDLPIVNLELLEGYKTMNCIPVMTSRGCPFDCYFCTVTKVFGRQYRMLSPERVIAEIRNVLKHFGYCTIFFYDDNFTANRKRIKDVCRLIIQEKLLFDWTAQVRSDIARDEELLTVMARAGCRRLFIGFESINDDTLKAMHKSQTRQDIEVAIKVIREHGISIHGMFIFGEDHDTLESIGQTVDFAIQHHIDTVQFMVLTPFPGTRFYQDIVSQDRIIHEHWDYYDGMYAVFIPKNMSPVRLQIEVLNAYKKFYSVPRLICDSLRLGTEITIDALTLDFRHLFWYTFETIFLRGGARFIIGRFVKNFDSYLKFIERSI